MGYLDDYMAGGDYMVAYHELFARTRFEFDRELGSGLGCLPEAAHQLCSVATARDQSTAHSAKKMASATPITIKIKTCTDKRG